VQINKILKGLNSRIVFFILLSLGIVFVLVFRLAQLQLNNDKQYIKAIQQQSLRPIRVPAVRGRIESSDGKILVDNKVSYDLVFFLPEFKVRSAGGVTRTSEYIRDVLLTLAELLKLETTISSSQIAAMLKSNSKEKISLLEVLSQAQINRLNDRNLPPFIVLSGEELLLDYEKVELLDHMNGIDRTVENIILEVDRVCILIGRPLLDIKKKIKAHMIQKPALPFNAIKSLSVKERALINEMLPALSSATIIANPVRFYPFPFEYSHMLGYTRLRDPSKEDEEKRSHFFYFLRSLYGVSGIEFYKDEELKGVAGKKVVQVNITGFVQEDKSGKHSILKKGELVKFNYEPKNGNNVTLTIDHEAQSLAYKALVGIPDSNLLIPREPGQVTRAAFVLMDCNTGAIKAMVSTPSFDMGRFARGESAYFDELYGEVGADKKRINPERKIPFQLRQTPLINRSFNPFEPGSIIKPLLALAALKEGNFDPNRVIHCEGYYTMINGRKIRCASQWGHGDVDLKGAIEQSCNKYFITLGLELGVEKMAAFYRHAGIGRYPLTGVFGQRFPQEKKGLLPGVRPWYYADTAFSSIGQGKFTVSPLQAAIFTAAIANGGKVLRPYIIEKISNSRNEEVIETTPFPQIADNLQVSAEVLEKVKEGMRLVVVGDDASGARAQAVYEGSLELAGKTGTAEVTYVPKDEEGKNLKDANGKTVFKKFKNTWFVAYAPYDKPKYVAVCFVQGGVFGGVTCAPVVREFFDTWSKTRPKKME
jgi:penicillin-binding protein 2